MDKLRDVLVLKRYMHAIMAAFSCLGELSASVLFSLKDEGMIFAEPGGSRVSVRLKEVVFVDLCTCESYAQVRGST